MSMRTWFFSTLGRIHRIQHLVDLRFHYPVEYIPAVPAVLDDACLAQHCQLLREVCLAVSQGGFHVANTFFTIAQGFQYCQAGGMCQQLKEAGWLFVWVSLCFYGGHNIQNTEYDFTSSPSCVKVILAVSYTISIPAECLLKLNSGTGHGYVHERETG